MRELTTIIDKYNNNKELQLNNNNYDNYSNYNNNNNNNSFFVYLKYKIAFLISFVLSDNPLNKNIILTATYLIVYSERI